MRRPSALTERLCADDRHLAATRFSTACSPLVVALLLGAATSSAACGDDGPGPSAPVEDVVEDAADSGDAANDTGTDGSDDPVDDAGDTSDATPDVDAGTDVGPEVPEIPEGVVPVDINALFDPPGSGEVRLYQIGSEDELIPGDVASAQIGDWRFDNGQASYVIGLGDRAIGACSWDGNPIEAIQNGDGGSRNIFGEICMLMNIGQTMRPERADLISDGSDGRALLAITGRPSFLDFLNLDSMAGGFAPGLLDLVPIDPNRLLPFTVTIWYGLSPDSDSLRVVYAFRNDGDAREWFVSSQLMLGGSTGTYFTPFSSTGGFGYRSLGTDNLTTDAVSFVTYASEEGGYGVLPDPVPALGGRLPTGGGMVAVSGAVAITFGTTNLLQLLLANANRLDRTPGFIGLEPGEIATTGYRLYVGDGSVSSIADRVFVHTGVASTRVSGRVVAADGTPIAGALVTPVEEAPAVGRRALTQARTGADGGFAMLVPNGTFELRVRAEGRHTFLDLGELTGDERTLGDIALPEPGEVLVRITDPAGQAVPGRITLQCEGECGDRIATSVEIESDFRAPNGWERIVPTGPSGEATLLVAPGTYRLMVSRGMTWSTWPADAHLTQGALVEVTAGTRVAVDAEIAQVVDTAGFLSSDFHIHAMGSPDSSVSNRQRVLDFLSEGLDVISSSDHDAVTSYSPTLAALGVEEWMTSMMSIEITTPGIGHFNAYPMRPLPDERKGGPPDWSNGGSDNMTMAQLSDAVLGEGRARILQLNHPAGRGTIGTLEADVLTGRTFADRATLRMPPGPVDPETGDTGLWSDEFNAIEIMNGYSENNFWSGLRWWMIMIGRGFSPTGTATSDTHGLYGNLGASPRSFVLVGDGNDSIAAYDEDVFATAIEQGRLLGTNGPFVDIRIVNTDGDEARMGDTLAMQGPEDRATVRITVQTPEWMAVDRVDLYVNAEEGLFGEPGVAVTPPLAGTYIFPVLRDPATELVTVVEGTQAHRRWQHEFEIELEVTQDTWVVAIARSAEGPSMRPVLASSVRPLAFTNPVFIDADGGGYDNPPLLPLLARKRNEPAPPRTRAPVVPPGDEAAFRAALGHLLDHADGCGHFHDDEHGHHHH